MRLIVPEARSQPAREAVLRMASFVDPICYHYGPAVRSLYPRTPLTGPALFS